MLAQVLALHLALLDPAPSSPVHLVPPLALDTQPVTLAAGSPESPLDAAPATEDPASARPADAAPMVARAEPRAGSVLHGYGGALAGGLASDLVFVGLVALAAERWADSGGLFHDGNQGWILVALAGATGFVFVTPAAMSLGAEKATRRRGYGAAAYAAAFAIRLLGFFLARSAPGVIVATELVAAPLAAGAIVAAGSPVEQRAAPPPDFPDEPVPRPVPDPARARISRPICPDAALALR